MNNLRDFREDEKRQLDRIRLYIILHGLNASIEKIKKWVKEQPESLWLHYISEVEKNLNLGIVFYQFKKTAEDEHENN